MEDCLVTTSGMSVRIPACNDYPGRKVPARFKKKDLEVHGTVAEWASLHYLNTAFGGEPSLQEMKPWPKYEIKQKQVRRLHTQLGGEKNQTQIPLLINLNTCLKPLFSKLRPHYVYLFEIDRIKSPSSLHYGRSKMKMRAWRPQAPRTEGFMCKRISVPPIGEWSYLQNHQESAGTRRLSSSSILSEC